MGLKTDLDLVEKITNKVKSKLKLTKTIKETTKNDEDWFAQFGIKDDKNVISPQISNIVHINGKDLDQHFEILKDRENDKYYVMVHFESNDFSLPSIIEETIKFFCSKNGLVEYLGKQWSNTSKKRKKWGWFGFPHSDNTTLVNNSTKNIDDLVSVRGKSLTLEKDIADELLRLYRVFVYE